MNRIFKDYQEIHEAIKAKTLKIGDKAKVKAYGGLSIEITPPEYKGEINAIGMLVKYKIKEIQGF